MRERIGPAMLSAVQSQVFCCDNHNCWKIMPQFLNSLYCVNGFNISVVSDGSC